MNERLRKARRMLAVQADLDRLGKWRLSDLERQGAALMDRRRDLLRFLDGESAFTGLFATALMRRLHGLDETGGLLFNEVEAQAARVLEERARMRQIELIVNSLEGEARRREDKQQLAEALEVAQNRPA